MWLFIITTRMSIGFGVGMHARNQNIKSYNSSFVGMKTVGLYGDGNILYTHTRKYIVIWGANIMDI